MKKDNCYIQEQLTLVIKFEQKVYELEKLIGRDETTLLLFQWANEAYTTQLNNYDYIIAKIENHIWDVQTKK